MEEEPEGGHLGGIPAGTLDVGQGGIVGALDEAALGDVAHGSVGGVLDGTVLADAPEGSVGGVLDGSVPFTLPRVRRAASKMVPSLPKNAAVLSAAS